MNQPNEKPKPRRARRAASLLFLTLAVLATFALAWWQWTRFRSGSGTFQNLGYALQWPLFGAFFVYAYRKFHEYEAEVSETGVSPVERELRESARVTEIAEDFLPERPTLDVETYNRLNAPTRRHASRRPPNTNEQ